MLSSPMDSELILFLEENGFAECKSRAGEFDKTISNNYPGGLMVSISEDQSLLNKNKTAILIETFDYSGSYFIIDIESPNSIKQKIEKLLGIIKKLVQAFIENEHYHNHNFADFDDNKSIHETKFFSEHIIIDISGDEAFFDKRTDCICKVCDNVC
jgi:hypothetical protein